MRTLVHLVLGFARDTAGTAAIETIIALPVAVSLMVGGVEFGRLFSAYATADKTMRDATRYLARVPKQGVCTGGNQWGLTNARNLAMYGMVSPPLNTPPVIPGWTDPNTITLTPAAPACNAFGTATKLHLRAQVPFAVFMLTAIGFSNNFTLTVDHEERFIGE